MAFYHVEISGIPSFNHHTLLKKTTNAAAEPGAGIAGLENGQERNYNG
jgi:hypothetical protein